MAPCKSFFSDTEKQAVSCRPEEAIFRKPEMAFSWRTQQVILRKQKKIVFSWRSEKAIFRKQKK